MSVIKARKKPVVVEVLEWNGNNQAEVSDFMGTSPAFDDKGVAIETLEGTMYAKCGDIIIKGVQGEFYPCKPDIFHATYDFVLDS